jgi:hypothetical protein
MDSNGRRALVLGAASAALVGGSGCFTMLSKPYAKKVFIPEKELFTDTIQALGRPSESLLKEINIPGAVVFLGVKHAYFLVEGGDKILQFANHPYLAGIKFELVFKQNAYIKDGMVWGRLYIRYGEKGVLLSSNEIAALKNLGFDLHFEGFFAGISLSFRGKSYPPIDLSKSGFGALKRTYDLTFYEPSTSASEVSWSGILTKLPLTLALDVVTLPIQLIGFPVTIMTIAAGSQF